MEGEHAVARSSSSLAPSSSFSASSSSFSSSLLGNATAIAATAAAAAASAAKAAATTVAQALSCEESHLVTKQQTYTGSQSNSLSFVSSSSSSASSFSSTSTCDSLILSASSPCRSRPSPSPSLLSTSSPNPQKPSACTADKSAAEAAATVSPLSLSSFATAAAAPFSKFSSAAAAAAAPFSGFSDAAAAATTAACCSDPHSAAPTCCYHNKNRKYSDIRMTMLKSSSSIDTAASCSHPASSDPATAIVPSCSSSSSSSLVPSSVRVRADEFVAAFQRRTGSAFLKNKCKALSFSNMQDRQSIHPRRNDIQSSVLLTEAATAAGAARAGAVRAGAAMVGAATARAARAGGAAAGARTTANAAAAEVRVGTEYTIASGAHCNTIVARHHIPQIRAAGEPPEEEAGTVKDAVVEGEALASVHGTPRAEAVEVEAPEESEAVGTDAAGKGEVAQEAAEAEGTAEADAARKYYTVAETDALAAGEVTGEILVEEHAGGGKTFVKPLDEGDVVEVDTAKVKTMACGKAASLSGATGRSLYNEYWRATPLYLLKRGSNSAKVHDEMYLLKRPAIVDITGEDAWRKPKQAAGEGISEKDGGLFAEDKSAVPENRAEHDKEVAHFHRPAVARRKSTQQKSHKIKKKSSSFTGRGSVSCSSSTDCCSSKSGHEISRSMRQTPLSPGNGKLHFNVQQNDNMKDYKPYGSSTASSGFHTSRNTMLHCPAHFHGKSSGKCIAENCSDGRNRRFTRIYDCSGFSRSSSSSSHRPDALWPPSLPRPPRQQQQPLLQQTEELYNCHAACDERQADVELIKKTCGLSRDAQTEVFLLRATRARCGLHTGEIVETASALSQHAGVKSTCTPNGCGAARKNNTNLHGKTRKIHGQEKIREKTSRHSRGGGNAHICSSAAVLNSSAAVWQKQCPESEQPVHVLQQQYGYKRRKEQQISRERQQRQDFGKRQQEEQHLGQKHRNSQLHAGSRHDQREQQSLSEKPQFLSDKPVFVSSTGRLAVPKVVCEKKGRQGESALHASSVVASVAAAAAAVAAPLPPPPAPRSHRQIRGLFGF